MSENIKLHRIQSDNLVDSSEEYHEISQDLIDKPLLKLKSSESIPDEYDFFTQYDIKKAKHAAKKEKSKKKEKSPDLMDLIHSEISVQPIFIPNNVTNVDANGVNSYLDYNSKMSRILQSGSRNLDAEYGYARQSTASICPIFPRILDVNNTKDNNVYVQYMEPSLFNDIVSDYSESNNQYSPKFLDVILRNIKFRHHHEFSLEKLLSVKLLEVYEEYDTVTKSLIDLSRNIELNRRTRNNLKKQLLKVSPNNKDDVRFDESVMKYTKLMLEFKEKYFNMIKLNKEIIHKLKSLWADIKMVREKSGSVMTNYSLEIEDSEMHEKEFHNQWVQVFENEYSDLVIKIEYEFAKKYLEYKHLKRNQNRDCDKRSKIVKPKLIINYDDLKTEVEKKVSDILLKSKTKVFLKSDKTILSDKNKKKNQSFNNYFFKIFVNEIFVGESEVYTSNTLTWDIDFEECLTIEILPTNNSFSIKLYENDENISFFHINLFDIRKNTNESNFSRQTFTHNKLVEPTPKTVGSGYDIKEICRKNKARLKSGNLFKGELFTYCEVNVKLGWNAKLNDNLQESVKSCMNIEYQIKHLMNSPETVNIDAVSEILNYLYEYNVESNLSVMTQLKNICRSHLKTSEIMMCVNEQDLIRHKLLYLRNNRGLSDIQNKTISLSTSQHSTEHLDSLRKNEEDIEYIYLKCQTIINTLDLQRFIGIKFVEKLNNNLTKKVNDFLLRKTYKDVVRDFEDLSFGTIISNRTDLSFTAGLSVAGQRALNESLSEEQEIQITVLKATNLSDRSPTILTEEENEDDIAGFKIHALRPFVRISYNGVSAQTGTAIGCHPTWNHTVKIKTRLEPVSSILFNIYDECKENVGDLYSDDQSAQTTVYFRKSNKWLGTLRIPLHTVLNCGNLRGSFNITTPILTIGYEHTYSPKDNQSFISEVKKFLKKEKAILVLHISTSISHLGGYHCYDQPVSNAPQDDFIIKNINEFVTDYVNDFPTRNISLTFINSSGKNKCVSEFFQAIPLPDYECFPINPKKTESALSKSSGHSKSSSSRSSRKRNSITGEDSLSSGFEAYKSDDNHLAKSMDAAVRYVSLIPTYDVTGSYAVTLLGVELLKVLYGSPLDHTILLASYFLHLRIKCWIIVGFGLPRGQSSYVLVKYCNNQVIMDKSRNEVRKGFLNKSDGCIWYIYDAVSGERFGLREMGCPLKSVSYVFDSENVWVNVQTSEDCQNMSFDFDKSSDWQVVFDKPYFMTRSPVGDSLYSTPGDTETLKTNLENKIKNKVQKWRSHVKTIWNRYCSGLLKEVLHYYEYWSFNPTDHRPNLGHRLKQLMATYKIFGFPLNMPYLNAKQIIANIKSTAIHVNDDPNVEFGLSVEIYAYPNNVLSVWVFLVSITRI